MANAQIKVILDDGSDCYITVVPVNRFDSYTIAAAAGEALALFVRGFTADETEMSRVWDPVLWKKKMDARRNLG